MRDARKAWPGRVSAPKNKKAAHERAMAISDVVRAKLDTGKSLRAITEELNTEGVPTARGGKWHLTSVKRLVDRLAA